MMVACRAFQVCMRSQAPERIMLPLQWRALFLVLLILLPWLCYGKMCTNTGVSHTLQSQLFAAAERSSFITEHPSAPGNFSSRIGGSWRRVMLQKGKNNSSFMEAVSLHNLRLSPDSQYGVAQQTNLEYLLMLDVDSLVHSFRKTAGIDSPGSAYGGWEDPDSELRGHFVGHYLSATAMAWASTHNYTIYAKMNAVLGALAECQSKIGTGYLSAFPATLFDRFEALQPVWAPYYTIHKIMAGLLDQYTFAENDLAFEMLTGMAQYFSDRVEAVIKTYTIERHWQSLNEETGGMNDVMYRLYQLTGDKKHLRLAHLFDKPCFLGLLAVQADSVSDFHSNTHIPVVIGAQMRYEAVGDKLFKALSEYFMKIITSSHTYATGGTSAGEFWSDPNRLADTLGTENQESCTTYNMLKVARNLFRWTKEMKYVDFYERALLNGVLTIQRGRQPGVMIYMLPLAPGSSKAKSYHGWGTPYSSFWCCYGTAIESFSKLGDSIFYEDHQAQDYPHLYVTQFVSSTLMWNAAGLKIEQKVQLMTSVDPIMNVTFFFTQTNSSAKHSTLSVRIPYWTDSESSRFSLNGVDSETPTPGTFLSTTREWKTGDAVSFSCRAMFRLERIQDERPKFSSLYAIFFGPYLLAGASDGDNSLGSVNISSPSSWISPVAGSLFSFTQRSGTLGLATDANGTLIMIDRPSEGSREAQHATFKVVRSLHQSTVRDITEIHGEVSLELMHRPRNYVAHNGKDRSVRFLEIQDSSLRSSSDSIFRVVLPGVSGDQRSVSFEASSMPGCFLSAEGRLVKLRCGRKDFSSEATQAASFIAETGVASYNPMSFEAYGINSSFLLFPLTNYKDESYAVYFNTT